MGKVEINIENILSQMRKGILEYCILSILKHGDAYSSDIIIRLKEAKIIVVEGTLYPLLMRLKNQGYLSYHWEESSQGPPRKYYNITDQGKLLLIELENVWKELVEGIENLKHVK
ncbi:MAG: PadR family transcriptional regulator [Bacteroidales bacterium]|jgi:PadR family transcriptional regulator PadR|nr:PadR family transcriptional regulator [Bacteroidales bacterium]